MKNTKTSSLLICILLICLCCACGQSSQEEAKNPSGQVQTEELTDSIQESDNTIYDPDSYDTEDTAVFLRNDTAEKTITLYVPKTGETYNLEVVGSSTFADKYGEPLALSQLQSGDVVEVTYVKEIMRLHSMQLAAPGFTLKEVGKYTLDWGKGNAVIGKDVYQLPENVVLLSEGKQITAMDLNEVDILSFQGIGSSIYSIVVGKGHGYLRLDNATDFLGGFIEVGQSKITKITEDMLLTVPEGEYQVTISHNGGGGTKQVTIGRNQEVTLDVGDLEVARIQYGDVLFSSDLEEVSVYVDGKLINQYRPVSLQYGIHQVIAKAEGYQTLTGYFKVEKSTQNVDLDLIRTEEPVEEEKPKEYKVYVDKPEGAEVYLNDNYIGMVPVSFKKETGTHTITLRKAGYETRSYTIFVDQEEKDSTFTFADLVVSPLESLDNIVLE